MSESAPEGTEAQQNTEEAPPVEVAPVQPTTSPDVVITDDPGPAPEGNTPVDDGSATTEVTAADPASDDAAVDVLGEDGE